MMRSGFDRQFSNAWLARGATLTGALEVCARGMFECTKPDARLSIETNFFNTQIYAESLEYEFDAGKSLWLAAQRWSRLIKEYVPREHLDRFIANAKSTLNRENRDGASDSMFFHDPPRYAKKHRWGGCLMGAVFIGNPDKHNTSNVGTLIFYSRTTYIGYIGWLDAAIAYVMAWYITDGSPELIDFHWHIGTAQLHSFKTIPWLLNQPDLKKRLEGYAKRENKTKGFCKTLTPAWCNATSWYSKMIRDWEAKGTPERYLDEEKYGPLRRVKKCWLMAEGHIENRRPSWDVGELTFDKAQ